MNFGIARPEKGNYPSGGKYHCKCFNTQKKERQLFHHLNCFWRDCSKGYEPVIGLALTDTKYMQS